jgi:ribosomal protein S18 acetylase RimI-like enzyme
MDTGGVHIRTATPEQIPAVLELWGSSRSAAADIDDTEEDLRRLFLHDAQALLVAQADGRIVGTVVTTWDGWRGGIHRLVVLPAHRRRGVGRALIAAAHERLEALGAKRVNILVAEVDEGVGELWRVAGYRTDPRVARYFFDF